MADFKKFTGFVTPDGKTHATAKAASDHVRDQKINEALTAAFSDLTKVPNTTEDNSGNPAIYDAPTFLAANRELIQKCFAAEVRRRAPRTKKAAKSGVEAAVTTAVEAVADDLAAEALESLLAGA